ncbi:TniQ family protein [Thalassotalea ganghwensis]
MAFLFSPRSRAFADESLESYMLRVVSENYFSSYRTLSLAIKDELQRVDAEARGAFPIDLKLLNIYHAKQDSLFRVRALSLVEELLRLPKYELLKLALFRSDKRFMSSKAFIYRANTDIPLNFVRYAGQTKFSIPVCPSCIKEEAYIRQIWHLKPYKVCAIHQQDLLKHCPECKEYVNYIDQESITHCSCGFDLRTANTELTCHKDHLVSAAFFNKEIVNDNPLLADIDLSGKFSAIAWYQARKKTHDFDSEEIITYFRNWPECLANELSELKKQAKMKLLNEFNKTPFSFIFGQLITDSFSLSQNKSEPHFITNFISKFLFELVDENPRRNEPNIADMLLTISETAAILSTSYEQVYRLYETGILKVAIKQKLHQKLRSSDAVFYLRQIIELKKSYGLFPQGMFVSKW